ncbi:MAG: TlpA disulfide reductase family protein [Chloroflexota bacterium]
MSQDLTDSSTGNGRNNLVLIVGIIVILIALAGLIFGNTLLGGNSAEVESSVTQSELTLPTSGGPIVVGDTAIDFNLVDLDGNEVSLSDHLGQPIVINFWASWCAPCRIEMPELQAVHDNYQDEGLVILALNQEESAEVARDFFIDEMALTFTNPLLDSDAGIAREYGVLNLPTTVFIDENGVVTAVHRGPAVESQFEGYLVETIPNSN